MSKQILPAELAEIVTGLLVNPSVLGELDSPEKRQAFMLDIGRVVADHCGGDANWVNPADTDENYLSDQYSSPYLNVSPNDSLPSLANNVWAAYDREGWDEEDVDDHDITHGTPLSAEQLDTLRQQLQTLLLTESFNTPFTLKDNDQDKLSTRGTILANESGICIRFDGHSDCYSQNDRGYPVFIEYYEGEITLRIYSDVNAEEATHCITLANARNERRVVNG